MLPKKMSVVLLLAVAHVLAGLFGMIESAFCQQKAYPDHEVQILVGFAPGGVRMLLQGFLLKG